MRTKAVTEATPAAGPLSGFWAFVYTEADDGRATEEEMMTIIPRDTRTDKRHLDHVTGTFS